MKKTVAAISSLLFFFLTLSACTERGPTGPEGPEGPPGPEILPIAFDFEATVNQANNFEFIQAIPGEIEVFNSDFVLVFVLEDYIEEDDLDVWRKLPITEFNSRGTVLFDYDFTLIDIRLFLNANYALGQNDGYEAVLIRGVHVPANYMAKTAHSKSVYDVETFDELELFLGQEIKQLGKK
ncbi:MAG: hypothetical protein JJU13_17020 [Balneolaceae bacterium]|nr:hypothetical protein [Balneolaceae bacterium]